MRSDRSGRNVDVNNRQVSDFVMMDGSQLYKNYHYYYLLNIKSIHIRLLILDQSTLDSFILD